MKEALLARPVEKQPDHKPLAEILPKVEGRLDVGVHELKHVVAIWRRGKRASASTVATSQYEGVTIPQGQMSIVDMQVAAMASVHDSGNGSDMMKAKMLEPVGVSVEDAAASALSAIGSYHEEVLRGAAAYLVYHNKFASDSELRMFFRWAEEELQKKDEYKDMPSWADELESLAEPNEESEATQKEITPTDIKEIRYQKDGSATAILHDGTEQVLEKGQLLEEEIIQFPVSSSWRSAPVIPIFTAPSALQNAA